MSRDNVDRETRSPRKRNEPEILTTGQDDLATIVSNALQRAFGQTDASVKRVMRAVNCNAFAARNWLQGKNAPNALYLLRLIATVPELQGEVRRLTAMESDMHPLFERDFLKLFQTYEEFRRGGR